VPAAGYRLVGDDPLRLLLAKYLEDRDSGADLNAALLPAPATLIIRLASTAGSTIDAVTAN
jgi:hypothetical protein